MMHKGNVTPPSSIDYARPPEPSAWPQSEFGGLSAVLGGTIIFFVVCVGILHGAFASRDHASSRMLLHIETGIFGVLAAVGCALAIAGLRQQFRRRSAAVVGLFINVIVLMVAALIFVVA